MSERNPLSPDSRNGQRLGAIARWRSATVSTVVSGIAERISGQHSNVRYEVRQSHTLETDFANDAAGTRERPLPTEYKHLLEVMDAKLDLLRYKAGSASTRSIDSAELLCGADVRSIPKPKPEPEGGWIDCEAV